MVRVKICGITRIEDALFAEECGADAIGLIFAKSPRQVNKGVAWKISQACGPWITRVGVFVEQDVQEILNLAEECGLDAVQVHRELLIADIESLKKCGRVIQVIRVKKHELEQQQPNQKVDAVLLDTWSEECQGGTGQTFDWEAALRAKEWGVPIILAGGLTPANVKEAVQKINPYGVDTSSGVESSPGIKDAVKVKEFIERAKDKD